ncbi:MAG TPA: DMT family transporter [Coleofasciculaceae cyanobacterium]
MNLRILKTIAYTCSSLIAFAGNSILCRLALGEDKLDAASFTIIRMLSGIVLLFLMSKIFNVKNSSTTKRSWISSCVLFLYAVTFSYAYISLDTGTGALILFGAVQITMILASLISKNRLHVSEWMGMVTAFSGFIYLVKPSLTTPSFTSFILMTISGMAWGIYTLRGKGSKQPIHDSAFNFLYTFPFILALLIIEFKNTNLSQQGIVLAVVSGAITSGVGYTVWYMAVRRLSTMQASVVQLLVPIIAATGGVIFANEVISTRLILSSIMILAGIVFVLLGQYFLLKSAS